ncbi:FixH family protein [Palleronia caenipelagi]|uniref:FixH family protein n=2 Tax=Palleronia caenipelagi TaxID=2489174 RepID=A0A547PTC0_9RHOB|nr:FixH family protein [Palleronia caenipelagi]
MFVGGFSIIIAVNVLLAVNAVRTFPGLEVDNSYVASQSFEARRDAQDALGWKVEAAYRDGALSLAILDKDGQLAELASLDAHIGRPTEARDDTVLELRNGGSFAVDLAPGKWRLDVSATAEDGTLYEKAIAISVKR